MIPSDAIQTLEKGQLLKHEGGESTYEAIRKDLLILKEMNKINENQVPTYIQKIEFLNKINHPNIVKTRGFLLNDKKTPPTILLERCVSNLSKSIETKKFNKVDSSFAVYQIAEGMKFIHSNGIMHSNLKPSNILVASNGIIKISDVGLNDLKFGQIQGISLNSEIESLYFTAPEVLNNSQSNEKVDVFSFGVLVYFIVSGGQLPAATLADLIRGKQFQIPSSFSPNAKEIVEFCCSADPGVRPSFNEIVDYLRNDKCILMDLNKSELAEVQNRIKELQKIIPQY